MNRDNKSLFDFKGVSKHGVILSAVIVVVLVLSVLLNALLGMVPAHFLKWNVTGASTFRVSSKTAEWLKTELNEDVSIYLIGNGGEENEVYLFLSDVAQKNRHVQLEIVDPQKDQDFIKDFGGVWPEENMSVLVASANRYKILENSELYYYYNTTAKMRYSLAEYEYYRYMFQQYHAAYPDQGYDQVLESFVADTACYFDGETQVISALKYVLMDDVSTLYAVTGSNEGLDTGLTGDLWKYGYEIKNLKSVQKIPTDCDLLVLQVAKDINDLEKMVLDNYLKNGGKLFLTTFYGVGDMPNLGSVLEQYGMDFLEQTHLLMEGDQNYISISSDQTTYLMRAHIRQHGATGTFAGSFLLDLMNDGVHIIDVKEVEGVTVTPWLQTSAKGVPAFRTSDTSSESGEEGVYTFGAIAEKGDTRIIWVATPSALSAAVDSQSGGGNFGLVSSAFRWMTETNETIFSADARVKETSYLTVSDQAFVMWGTVLVIVLPAAILAIGIVIWYARKRK
ncbi:MAG: hypothetical protein E7629_06895 [Ruminococcaceae bacterium]|nr:hypothetical protein [Oscillospiraceae bacterium]